VTVSEINAVVSETRIAATPQTVFAFFVDPTKMVRWMGARAVVDARPGGTYALDINAQARARGEFVEVVPYSRVVFTFGWEDDQAVPPGSSTVEVTLTPDGEGYARAAGPPRPDDDRVREQHSHGWQLYLGRLGIAAGGGDPGPDPNTRSTSEGG